MISLNNGSRYGLGLPNLAKLAQRRHMRLWVMSSELPGSGVDVRMVVKRYPISSAWHTPTISKVEA